MTDGKIWLKIKKAILATLILLVQDNNFHSQCPSVFILVVVVTSRIHTANKIVQTAASGDQLVPCCFTSLVPRQGGKMHTPSEVWITTQILVQISYIVQAARDEYK
ncbi:hypothetical protein GDO78_016537 [Eleutherodactylus coqui]|uniref:Secreted protein n=1 Tax=Eleutherodactylus coqui TaxID=57060 RepID=A0A8J6ENZ4_ELECQ|nr:hypothetical protein GDO78_016537 [Eleutherodactylus coqui]